MPHPSSPRPHLLLRGRRLGGRAVLIALLSGSFTGVTAASADPGGNGPHNGWNNPNNPHYDQAASSPAPAAPSAPAPAAPSPPAPTASVAPPALPGNGKHLGRYNHAGATDAGNGNGRAVGHAKHLSAVTRAAASAAPEATTVHALVASAPPTAVPAMKAVTRAAHGTRPSRKAAPRTSVLTVASPRVAPAGLARARANASATVRQHAVTRPVAAPAPAGSRAATAVAVAHTGGAPVQRTKPSPSSHVAARPAPARVTAAHLAQSPLDHAVTALNDSFPTPIRDIPAWIKLALTSAIALAAAFAFVAIRNGRRAQRQAREIAAASAAVAAASAAAIHDPLTGLLNRRGFEDAVTRELARARRHGREFVIAYADVRGLKTVNDTLGHAAGDTLLRSVADVLTGCARGGDTVARHGGDEFALLLAEHSADDAIGVTTRIADAVEEARAAFGLPRVWDLTVGTAAFPADGEDAETLLDIADRRLYEQRGIALAGAR